MRLEHTAVRPHDPAHDRLVHRVSPGERSAHLDPYDVTALCRGDDDRRVDVAAARHQPGPAGRVDAGDVRDQMRERGHEPPRVDLGLDRWRVHGELRPARTDQLDSGVDPGRDHAVEQHVRLDERLGAAVQALVAQHVVDERRHARVAGGQVVQDLVRLGPQLARGVGGERGQLAAQLLERPAQRLAEHGGQLGVPGGQVRQPLGLLLQLGGVPLGAVRQFGRVLFRQSGDFGGVPRGEVLELRGVARGQLLDLAPALLVELLVRAAVGERHDRADQLVAVPHGRGGQVDGHLRTALGPQDLPAHPVLTPRFEGVGQGRLLVRERLTLGP